MSGHPYVEDKSMDSRKGNPSSLTNNMKLNSHPHLHMFREAKKEIIKIYIDVDKYVSDCRSFVDHYTQADPRFADQVGNCIPQTVIDVLEKVKGIKEVIGRNQMKCAFFGRTSNGKSTVINAMLGSRVLPSGIGHTTSCFLQVAGTEKEQGYLFQADPSSGDSGGVSRPVESVSQLANSLSSARLSTDSLIQIYWPAGKCHLLKEDVVFLDSPGIDIDPDMDNWIDKHCLDADVFILVANSESTIMQAEKKFFHKVSQKLSKPNIFILNNRWDASANEAEFIDEVRNQHKERCLSFLVDELKVCSKEEASDRVFFTSAKEALINRTRNQAGTAPPSPGPSLFADGWQSRYFEFQNFEKIFERTLSESATKTKFAFHCEQGKDISNLLRGIMEKVYETAVEEKNAAARYREMTHSRHDKLKSNLKTTSEEMEKEVRRSLETIEQRVASALNEEIRRLSDLVLEFRAEFVPDQVRINAFKRELNEHVERELGRKLSDACSADMSREVMKTVKLMQERFGALATNESKRADMQRLFRVNTFDPEFHMDCRNICANFQEDISFRFSLGFTSLMHRFMQNRQSKYTLQRYNDPSGNLQVHAQSDNSSQGPPSNELRSAMRFAQDGQMLPVVMKTFPSLISKNTVGAVITLGLVVKVTGWRVLGLCGAIYGGLYLYERLSWTTKAKERAFKRQYVDYASQKLRLIVDLTSANASHQAKQELVTSQKKLQKEIELCVSDLKTEMGQMDEAINRLDQVTIQSKKLKNTAGFIDNHLNNFHQNFIVGSWTPE